MEKIEILDNGCWRWIGHLDAQGYGRINSGKHAESLLAHRVSYRLHVGPLSEYDILDHLCRNHWCVNPDHLEPVTHRQNIVERGMSPVAILHRARQCKNGHPVNEENTYFRKGTGHVVYCRVCRREARS